MRRLEQVVTEQAQVRPNEDAASREVAMELRIDEIRRGLLKGSLETATVDENGWRNTGKGPGSNEGDYIDWLTFSDNAQSVVADVTRIRNHPLVPASVPVYGYIYDVKTGKLVEIPEATAAGKGS